MARTKELNSSKYAETDVAYILTSKDITWKFMHALGKWWCERTEITCEPVNGVVS